MRKKILIIDDDKKFISLVKVTTQLISNYTFITASSGKKGIRAALKETPDLILLDVMMPGMDGFEVLKRLKKSEETQYIPVIMLTAKNEDESKVKAAGLYCEDYIVKPVEIKVLKAKIHKVLSMKIGL